MPIDSTFIETLFEADDILEARLLPMPASMAKPRSDFVEAKKLTSLDAKLSRANTAAGGAYNIYVGANPRCRNGGTAADVSMARSLFVDIDNVDENAGLRRIQEADLPTPTVAVNSGHGVHFYWRLIEPLTDLTAWTASQKTLIRIVRSDAKIHDPPRIMRLPGFTNLKEPTAPCRLISANDTRYRLDELVQNGGEATNNISNATLASKLSAGSADSKGSEDSEGSVTTLSGVRPLTPEQVIEMCIPADLHEREERLFKLARGLKFNAGLLPFGLTHVKPFVQEWYRRAESAIATKGFDISWMAFIRAWERAELPLFADPVGDAFRLAEEQLNRGRLPAPADDFEDRKIKLLIGLCANLGKDCGERTFFLSTHVAGELLGVQPMFAHRVLETLRRLGHLEAVWIGNKKRATRYRWRKAD